MNAIWSKSILEAKLQPGKNSEGGWVTWKLIVTNTGMIAAHNFAVDLDVPKELVSSPVSNSLSSMSPIENLDQGNVPYVRFRLTNSREAEDPHKTGHMYSGYVPVSILFSSDSVETLANRLYIDPVKIMRWEIRKHDGMDDLKVYWRIFADDAPPRSGEKTLMADRPFLV